MIHNAKIKLESGEVFTWGNGSEGQLGIGTLSNHYSPQLVNFLHPQNNKRLDIFCIDIECGSQHTGVITGTYFASTFWGLFLPKIEYKENIL